jgi:hypothetical protein
MSGSTFITSIDDEITPQDQRSNEPSVPLKFSTVARAIRKKLSPDILPSQSGDITKLKQLPSNIQRPQLKLALGKKKIQDLAKIDIHDAIRGSIKNSNSAVPLGTSAPTDSDCPVA